jgi:hypothetical protein
MLVGQIQKSLQELESRQTREQRDKWKEKGQSASTGFEALDRTAQVQSEATAR